ncbi:MAG: glycoside hydrolase family 125 protein [Chloroflexota bacterium]
MANGRPKDNNAYQLDQQIFPLLEICGWLKHKTENDSYPTNWDCKTFSALQAILASKADSWKRYSPLFETDETPADDDLAYPCHFSSHILLWHTLRELRKYTEGSERITALLGISLLDPDELKQHINANFIAENDGKQIYAYAISQTDSYFYHDANDIPLVMMPIWGFCDKDDPVWRNTIEFAFSDENPGFYDGVLGSVHTPAPWALGDAQELIMCKVIGDRDRYARVWQRVEKAAQWDGALPEAYDANTFEVVSRHWFAWPNAMIAIADSISWDWEQEAQA